MRGTREGLALAVAAFLLARVGFAHSNEVYWQSGGGYFGGPGRVVAGYGVGIGYRRYLTESLSGHVEARWLLLLGNAVTAATGLSYEVHLGPWSPAFGGQVVAFFGNQIRLLDPDHPSAPPPVAWAVQVHLAPLHFAQGSVSASALSVDAGFGMDRGEAVPAVLFSLLTMGYSF